MAHRVLKSRHIGGGAEKLQEGMGRRSRQTRFSLYPTRQYLRLSQGPMAGKQMAAACECINSEEKG